MIIRNLRGKTHAAKTLWRFIQWFENWPAVWTAYRRAQHLPELRIRGGVNLFHSHADDAIQLFNEIFVDRCYGSSKFYTPREGDTVVDIGANIGTYVLYLNWLKRGTMIHCDEPAIVARNQLLLNVERNGLQACTKIHPLAVGGQGELRLFGSDDSGHRSSFESRFVSTEIVEAVSSVTLDTVLSNCSSGKIDFLKIDIEGGEVELFENASDKTMQKVERVAVEYHDIFREGCKHVVLKHLVACGMTIIIDLPATSDGLLGTLLARRPVS